MKDNDRKILCGMLKFARRVSKRMKDLSYEMVTDDINNIAQLLSEST